jgi:hypothetical protein
VIAITIMPKTKIILRFNEMTAKVYNTGAKKFHSRQNEKKSFDTFPKLNNQAK